MHYSIVELGTYNQSINLVPSVLFIHVKATKFLNFGNKLIIDTNIKIMYAKPDFRLQNTH